MNRLAYAFGIVGAAAAVAACGSAPPSSSSASTQPAAGSANCPSPGARFGNLAAAGTVTDVKSNQLTVHDNRLNKDFTVMYDPSVTVRAPGRQTESLSDIQKGSAVGIVGTPESGSSNTVHATTILVRPSPGQGQVRVQGGPGGEGARRRAGCPPPQQQGG